MRGSAIIPVLLAAAAVVLSFLCLFAGHKPGWMEDYNIITLNTSRIGRDLLSNADPGNANEDNPLIPNLIEDFTDDVQDNINDGINSLVDSVADQVGVEDWYSYHILDYCYGDYEPQSVPEGNVTAGDIKKNVTACSNRTAMFHFDPTQALQNSLDTHGVPITLADLKWPDEITNSLTALQVASKASFVLYCIGIALSFVSLLTSALGLCLTGRITAFFNIFTAVIAFLALGIASAIVTAVMVKGTNVINQYGEDIGVAAYRGNKYLALTWAATAAMFLATLQWCIACCVGHRKTPRGGYVEKPRV